MKNPRTLLSASSLEKVLFLGWSLLAKCAIMRTPTDTSLQVPLGGILKFVIIIKVGSSDKKYLLANEWI